MIPQAVASCGPYADIWSHLKSIIHSLQRASAAENVQELQQLDKERLRALSDFLAHQLAQKSSESVPSFGALGDAPSFDPAYALGLDLRQVVKDIPAFEDWNASQKLGTEKKLQRLKAALDTYLESLGGNWLNKPPVTELGILKSVLSQVLIQTESALRL